MLERERPVLDAADSELLRIVHALPYRQRA